MKNLKWICFVILIAAQWYVPANMIIQKERVLQKGQVVKFQTAPIDPSDPIRGKYVFLSFKEDTYKEAGAIKYAARQKVYVILTKDQNDFASISGISAQKPAAGTLFVEARVNHVEENGNVHVNYPFDRFYMDEYSAPEAERIYNESRSDTSKKAYALLHVLDGTTVIRDVLVNDTSIVTLARRRR
jgi:uncharacterized membrane-anchored protein